MGCDIHHFFEVRRGNRWYSVHAEIPSPYGGGEVSLLGAPDLGRNYSLFGHLAGVRHSPVLGPIAEPRGLPEDISPEVQRQADFWEDDAHSHSWLTLKEIRDNQDRHRQLVDLAEHMTWSLWGYGRGDSVRMVFWFDN